MDFFLRYEMKKGTPSILFFVLDRENNLVKYNQSEGEKNFEVYIVKIEVLRWVFWQTLSGWDSNKQWG